MPQKTSKQKWVDQLTLFKISLSKKQRVALNWATLVFLVAIPVVIISLPIDYFDQGTSVCLSKAFFNIECYACGLTRACKHLLHFDFETAFAYNMGSFVAFPLVSFLWTKWFLAEVKLNRNLRKEG
jgi:Protein of unknown function (DUF2752)